METWLWLALNGIVGVPLALAVWSVAREIVRSLVALALGFRVFEWRLGVGRARFRGPLGPVDLSLGSLPIGGASHVRSGSPRRYRAGRVACAIVPPLLSMGWLAFRALSGDGGFMLPAGPDPWAVFEVSGLGLVAFHLLIPVELPGGVRTDSRMLLDALLERAGGSRAARASYYARLARHHLERGRAAEARTAIERGGVQLGPEPLLVACRARLDADELDSVVDQGDCADALQRLIEEAEPSRAIERRQWGLREWIRQAAASALPLTIALGGLGIVRAEPLMDGLETRLLARSDAVAASADREDCASTIAAWSRWSRLDRLRQIEATERRDRHDRLARLEACRHDARAAAGQRDAARRAALDASDALATQLSTAPAAWVDNEVFIARGLMEDARQKHLRRAHREALAVLRQAEDRATAARARLAETPSTEGASIGMRRLESLRADLRALRARLIDEM